MAETVSRREFVKAGATLGIATAVAPRKAASLLGKEKTPRWGMLIDLTRCYGCKACAVACKSEFDVRLGVFKSNVIEREKGTFPETRRSFLPWLCNHCSKPLCVSVCPTDAVEKSYRGISYLAKATYKRPDGAVLYDIERCIGCHACVEACPYKARYIEPLLRAGAEPENSAIGKCTFCMHRVEKGIEPSCVNTCPANARVFGDLRDPESEVSRLVKQKKGKIRKIHPDYGTAPNVGYIDYEEDSFDNGDDIRNHAPVAWGQRRV